jgi:catechol 2,3-dioxygenase
MPIDSGARIGAVHLTVADLDRQVAFYEACLGLTLRLGDDRTAWLGAGGEDVLVLHRDPSARRVPGTTGLYHFAVLVPARRDLARALRRLVDTRTSLQGVADHGVSEALYLADAEGNGIEIYRDRPREEWPMVGGQLQMGTDPLDLDGLLSELESGERADEGMPAATRIGHVHLHVADLVATEQFYTGVLGFELTQRLGRSASFFAAGGYHHHIGTNIWAGAGAPPPPPGALGLDHFEIVLNRSGRFNDRPLERIIYPSDSTGSGDLVRDPSGNAIRLTERD